MRFLLRLIVANPTLLFTTCTVLVIVFAVLGFVWSERRARAMAELADDPELASGQRRRLAVIGVLTLAALGFAGWWSFVRVHTEPQRVVVAIAVEDGQWWEDDAGARAIANTLGAELERVGLEPVALDGDAARILSGSGDDPEALPAAARKLEARWLIRGRVRVDTAVALELADFSDYVLAVELELVDSETEEVFEIPGAPLRVFLWGEDPSDAVALNAEYLGKRVTMPLLASLAAREPLRAFTGERSAMTTENAVLAASLERLFARADNYTAGLAQRERDREAALKREPQNHAALGSERISDILAEEYFIGPAADGRVVLLSEPKFVDVSPDKNGYVVTSEGEELVLGTLDGDQRALLFEHYNFYSAPEISADGRVLWTTVANHGASKSLATIEIETGEFAPVLSHASDYYTSPIPAPDGSRALFYSRPGRYAEVAIELIGRDGTGREQIVGPGEQAGVPSWSPDGRTIYLPLGGWQRIVAVDPETRTVRHVLGQDPDAPVEPAAAPTPTPDPRHAGSRRFHHGAPAADEGPDPARSSRFTAVSVGHDGGYLYVLEQSLDGREWLGRFELEVDPKAEPPPAPYARLAQVEGRYIRASPAGPLVALEVRSFTAPGDPAGGDQEVIVVGPDPGQLRALTLNDVDDELGGWSRDGRSVFTIQRDRDPGDDRTPVVRVYRHELEE